MWQILFIALLMFHIESVYLQNDQNPTVLTQLGPIKGTTTKTVEGKTIYAFRGIRYAKAPVNELRFQPPVPVDKWNGTYDATQNGAYCPQPGDIPKSEDCLFLNVYTTKLPTKDAKVKRPVMFYLHPGGFYVFSGLVGPEYLLDHDVVFVTINYRLGSLGFISTGDHLAPGNNGFKDQILALKWVQENIAAFGGDPNLVTVTGYSAGSLSITLHLVSPMAKGLFHRAIAMSASGYAQWPIARHQFHLAQKQARLVGCPDDTSANIINCLKTKSAEELGDSLGGFAEFGGDPILIWTPVIEDDFGQERFLVEHPIDSIVNGRIVNDVPIMTGVTQEEFAGGAVELVRNKTLLKEMDENFEKIAPISFQYERDTERSKHISKELRKHFLGDGPLNNSSLPGLAMLYADGVIGFGVSRTAHLLAFKCTHPVYYYRFSYQGRYSFYYLPGTTTPYGVVHHDDLMYLYYIPERFPLFNESFPEYQMMRKLTKMHTDFARSGNPTVHKTSLLNNVKWIPFTNEGNDYLEIGERLEMRKNLNAERYDVWAELFPLP